MLEFLWRAGARTKDDRFFLTTELALTRMSQGGIYDHLGGGYARYSVDDKWLVPHFEKMLYDNAQILDMLALDYARIKNPLFRERAAETVGWLRREMTTPEGGFASSLDADSEGEEGKFYVWSLKEIEHALGAADAAPYAAGDSAAFFAAKYNLSRNGNFETAISSISSIVSMAWRTPPMKWAASPCCGRCCSRSAPNGCGPGSTTRSWPTGTG